MKKILAIFTFAAVIAASVLGGCSGDNKDKKSSLPEKAATTDDLFYNIAVIVQTHFS